MFDFKVVGTVRFEVGFWGRERGDCERFWVWAG